MRPRSSSGLGEKFYKLKNADKTTFYSSIEATRMSAPASKSTEEREIEDDSEASMHVLSKKKKSSEALETLRRSRTPTTVVTASGDVQTNGSGSLRNSAITRRNVCCSNAWKTLRRPRIFQRVGQRSETTVGQGEEDNYAKRTISYRLLFPAYPPILVAFRQQHRHCKYCLQQLQPKSEVTDLLQTTGTDHTQKPKTKLKRGMAVGIRMTVCVIFLNGWRR